MRLAELQEELDEAELARMSVSKAIRTAVRRIAEHDPELGDHLS